MELEYKETTVRRIVNIHKHVDGAWFWDKYSAHPYIGCRSGCEFCYARGGNYLGGRDPQTFDRVIHVKVNAVERLSRELPRLRRDILAMGDWQEPAERKYGLSRAMLEVVRLLDFPLFIVERSPLLLRDIDLLAGINRQSWVGVLYSISSLDERLKQAFEPRSPGVRRRLQAIAKLAEAGIMTGVSLMPVLPFIGDDRSQLDELVRAVKDHGGSCVLAAGLSMEGVQAERTLAAARRLDAALAQRWRAFYRIGGTEKPAYAPAADYNAGLGLRVREICARHGMPDRMPRYVVPGPLAVNKHIAEKLFLKCYDLELERAQGYRIWAYRRAAWTVDEMEENIAELYRNGGEAALCALPSIGKSLASHIGRWLAQMDM